MGLDYLRCDHVEDQAARHCLMISPPSPPRAYFSYRNCVVLYRGHSYADLQNIPHSMIRAVQNWTHIICRYNASWVWGAFVFVWLRFRLRLLDVKLGVRRLLELCFRLLDGKVGAWKHWAVQCCLTSNIVACSYTELKKWHLSVHANDLETHICEIAFGLYEMFACFCI
jgi:hypothetical protein